MVSELKMPKAPQGSRWQVRVWSKSVDVELINGSGTTSVMRTVAISGDWDIEAAMVGGAQRIIDQQEIAAELRAKHGVAIGLD